MSSSSSSSSSSSTSSSSSSSSSDQDDRNGGGDGGRRVVPGYDAPSSSSRRRRRRRGANEVLPEHFLEDLATQVAIEASRSHGRLAAAPSLVNLFQVCSTWRAVSQSELLWGSLTRQIWGRTHLNQATWRDEFVYHHRTFLNFRNRQYRHGTLHFDGSDVADPQGLICRCLTLSDHHLAAGFADGTVRLFDLVTLLHVGTYRPHPGSGLGLHPRAVSGIVMTGQSSRLIFATLDGDIHVAMIDGDGGSQLRRAHMGDVVSDGALVDFAGCDQFWVGLYAGVPGRAFHVWDAESEELLFVGGALTDPESIHGWRMLTELTQFVGRVRVTRAESASAVACTSTRVIVIDLTNLGIVLGERRYQRRGLIVTAMDTAGESYIVVDTRGHAIVRNANSADEVCRFAVRGASHGRVMGCMNLGYAIMSVGGVIRVYDVEVGQQLYTFAERIHEVNAMVANERHVAAYCSDTALIHLWDFGAQEE